MRGRGGAANLHFPNIPGGLGQAPGLASSIFPRFEGPGSGSWAGNLHFPTVWGGLGQTPGLETCIFPGVWGPGAGHWAGNLPFPRVLGGWGRKPAKTLGVWQVWQFPLSIHKVFNMGSIKEIDEDVLTVRKC